MNIFLQRMMSVLFILIMGFFGFALRADGADKGKKELTEKEKRQEKYMKFLASKGYTPELDPDGDVLFKYEGGNYIIQIDESDNLYLRLLYPNFWEIESEEERSDVLLASTVSNMRVKCAKVFMVQNNVWSVVEIFLLKPEDYEKLLPRSISAIQSSVEVFRMNMQELKKARDGKGKERKPNT